MPRRAKWWHILQASKGEATLAVDLYNQSAGRRNLEAFVVHMHLAWLYLLHAEFEQGGVDYRYWQSDVRRLVRIDGEPKTWELRECVKKRWDENHPIRKNIELFIGIRNKIEHRYDRTLAIVMAGYAHASVLNFERELVDKFGIEESMGDDLRFPVFASNITDQATSLLASPRASLPPRTAEFLAEFENGLMPGVRDDPQFKFRVYLIPQTASRASSDVAITFIHEDELTDDLMNRLAERERLGTVIVKERIRNVAHSDHLKPKKAAAAIEEQLPFKFSTADFITAWKHFEVRPASGDTHPERTDEKYCIYDQAHGDYVYTNAWIRKLVRECGTLEKYRHMFGKDPKNKSQRK